MKLAKSTALAFLFACAAAAAAADDAADVKAVVNSAYVEGVHIQGNAGLMRAGFAPEFRMLVLKDGKLTIVTLDEWAGRIEAGAAKKDPNAAKPEIKAEYALVDVTGNAAIARVEIYRNGKHTFTDYLSLYKFPDGWKIVGKIFQAHS
jgi:hypothetical protein